MEETAASSNKRARDEENHEIENENGSESSPESPESKRIRADFLFDILDDESEPDNTNIDSVMRSLEEEIAMPAPLSDSDLDPKQPDLGFLLEASDDELGLPPADAAEGEVISVEVAGYDVTSGADVEAVGFEKIWGLDDEIHLEFGFGSDDNGNGIDDGAVIYDGGLFDCGAGDFSDLTWRPEFSPAV